MIDWKGLVRQRLGGLCSDPGIVDELAQHLEDRFQQLRVAGASDDDARTAALTELDGDTRLRDEMNRAMARAATLATPVADDRARRWLGGLWQDLRYGARVLRRSPGFTVAAILTVALTTGPTTAVLGIANWLFLRPMPGVAEPDRLVTVNFGTPSDSGGYSVSRVSYAHAANMVQTSPSVQAMAGWQFGSVSVGVDGVEPSVRPAQFVSGNIFDVLGVPMVSGRGFLPDEDARPGGALITVLSQRLAQVLFPGEDAAGRTLRINGLTFTVAGVVRADFPGAIIQHPVDLWMTGLTSPQVGHSPPERWTYAPDRGPFYEYIARLTPGATFEQADLELRTAALALSETAPEARKYTTVRPMVHRGVGIDPLAVPLLWSTVRVLIATGALLIVLGAANLANLFLFRRIRRGPEAALRRALGASAGRLVQLQLAETMIVAFAGSLVGLGLIVLGQALLGSTVNTRVGPLEIPVDWRLAGVAFGLSWLVGVVLGLVPNRLAHVVSLSGALTGGGRATNRSDTRLRAGLATAQLALSLTLVVGALLFVASLRHLRTMDSGFDARNVTRATFEFRVQGYPSERSRQFLHDITARLQAQNPTFRVAFGEAVPLYGSGTGNQVFGSGQRPEDAFSASVVEVSPDYFAALGIRILAGRTFTPEEGRATGLEPGVLVNEALAARLYGTADVVGRVVTFARSASRPQRDIPIIGITGDVRWRNLTSEPQPMLFRPAGSMSSVNNVLVVQSKGGTADAVRRIRAVAASIDPSLPISASGPLDGLIDLRLSEERLFARVLTALAIIAFVLAAVGLHGLVSQSVVERTREFGVRLAIGASRAQIIRLVFRSSLLILALGIPLGLGLAYVGSLLVSSRLHGVRPGEPWVFVLGVTALIGVAVLASLAPARSASRANPVDVLRHD